jgi:hypothetical protein
MKTVIVTIKNPKPVVTSKKAYATGGVIKAPIILTEPTPSVDVNHGAQQADIRFKQMELELKYKEDGQYVAYAPPDKARFRFFQDAFKQEDHSARHIGKNIFDQIYCVDQILYKGLTKLSLENVAISDDFMGGANADDEQTATFMKVFKETFTQTDLVTTSWLADRKFVEAASCADYNWFGVNAGRFDNVITDDTAISFVLLYTLAESFINTDLVSITLEKPFQDSIANADTYSIVAAPVLKDVSTTADEIDKFDVGSVRVDDVDSVDKLTMNAGKGALDVTLTSESNVASVGSVIKETANAGDSGVAFMQNYALSDYFIEDYVGTSRRF